MTVATTTNRTTPVAGNGVATQFAFAYPYRASSDLTVISRDTVSGVETVKTEGVDYTVAGTSDTGTGGFSSGNVNFVTAPASGTSITISRETPATSSYDPTAGAADTAPAREGAIDRLTLLAQRALDKVSRAPKFKRSTASGITDIPMPDPPSGTDTQFIGWNAARDALVNYASSTLSAGQAVSSFVATLLAAASAAAFRTLIGLQQIRVTGIAYDPASLTNGTETESSSIAATGAAFGDHVQVFPPYDMQGINYWGYVKTADNVRIRLRNGTGGTIDLSSSAAWEIRVTKGGQA